MMIFSCTGNSLYNSIEDRLEEGDAKIHTYDKECTYNKSIYKGKEYYYYVQGTIKRPEFIDQYHMLDTIRTYRLGS